MSDRIPGKPTILLAIAAAVLLAGCGQRQEPAPTPPPAAPPAVEPEDRAPVAARERAVPSVTLTEADDGRAVTLRRGEVVEIRLEADRPAGYTWIPAANLLPFMSTDGVPQYEPDERAPESAPGFEAWRFIGREAGHAHLVFEYRRPLEADAPPQQTLTFHFDVE